MPGGAGRRHATQLLLALLALAAHRHPLLPGGPMAARAAATGVPDPGSDGEDHGVLMGYVHDRATDRSDLVLLDAQTLEDVAAVHLPGRVPTGFHGNWAPHAG